MPVNTTGFIDLTRYRTARHWVLPCLILLLLALKLHLIFLQNVNWDEFLFLSKIYTASRGDLLHVLQTGYIHAFVWLPHVSANEVDQVIAARGVMYAMQVGTCAFIYGISRKLFGSAAAAGVGVLVYLTFSYILEHGASFRADPIATFFLMAALWLLVRDRDGWWEVVSAGVLTGIAGIVTIKSILFVPTLSLAVLCLRGEGYTRRRAVEFFGLGFTVLTVFLALYVAHRYSLDPEKTYSAMSTVTKSTGKLILHELFFPRKIYFDETLISDPLAWFLLFIGFATAIGVALTRESRRRGIGLVGLGLPLVTLVFYRNAFPYYYVFMLAAPAVLVAGVVALAEKSLSAWKGAFPVVLVALVGFLSAGLVGRYWDVSTDRTIAQRQLIDTIHRMFPQPVPYIDRCSMISSFPKAGFFMSTWGIENYLDAGRPIMRDLLVDQKPVFLIGNILGLVLYYPQTTNKRALLPEDFDVLRANFVRHWGVVWVAGKKLDLATAGTRHEFEILVPGTYTVEGKAPVVIDGSEYVPGAFVELASGDHTILAHQDAMVVILRWGKDLYRPEGLPVSDPIFVPFYRKLPGSRLPDMSR